MNQETFRPPLRVAGYVATRKGDPERGPLVLVNSNEARVRLLEDGELAWVYGPRRHELAVIRYDESVGRGDAIVRDVAGVAPSEIIQLVKHDFDAGKSTRNLG